VNACLDALDRRHVHTYVLRKLRLAPPAADPKLARSETNFAS
jgi:hypothetical protein